MSLGSERKSVHEPLLRYAQEVGWEYLPPREALPLRGGEESPLLRPVLAEALATLNPGVVDGAKAEEVALRLLGVRPGIEGNLEVWEYLKGRKTLYLEGEKREVNLRFVDPEHPENNWLQVTEEFAFRSGPHRIRPDLVFLVNGMPVLVVEAKSPKKSEGVDEALKQLRRYHREGPELMTLAQLVAAVNLTGFRYGATWALDPGGLLDWREEREGSFESVVKGFLEPSRFLKALTEYVLFPRKDGMLSKVVLRPHQMRAVERVLHRARAASRRGLVWHTQGSGKTYTMLTAARMLLESPDLQNPTVLLLVDRNELEQQLFQNIEALGFSRPHLAESKAHLRELLEGDTRGLIISTIHKFEGMPPRVNQRENIYVLIDEAHRSTGGTLGNHLVAALPQATLIGFTGTPIDRTAHGQGTFKVFGGGDPKGYLDKYGIQEAIRDGATVPLHYQLAPNELRADREAMEREFWQAAELQGVADLEDLDRVLSRAVTLKNMLKSPERVQKVAAFVAHHFQERVLPLGYKAFLVAPDREGCALYKEALDQHLPPEWSQVVVSQGPNDPEFLKTHHLSPEEEAQVRRAFRDPQENPKILIVTEKLLTGYDAPVLYTLYLDKPMRDHVLLQAIARVNRPYTAGAQRKTTGLIVDFVGVFENLQRALAFDAEDVEGVVADLGVLKERFAQLVEEAKNYLEPAQGLQGDKAVEALLEAFRDREVREAFYRLFRELADLYEVLSPDPFLGPYLGDYAALGQAYALLRATYEARPHALQELARKTEGIVRAHTAGQVFPLEPPRALTPEALEGLLQEETPEVVRVFNLIRHLVALEGQALEAPYLRSIGERAEEVGRRFAERQLEAWEALEALANLVVAYRAAEEERRASPLSSQGFAAEWWLRDKGMPREKAFRVAQALEVALCTFPHWTQDRRQEGEVRKDLYLALLEAGVPKEVLISRADGLLDFLRRAE